MSMMFHEAVQRMQERPEFIAHGVRDLMVQISPSGMLMDIRKPRESGYVRFRASDMLNVMWVVHTYDQLEAMNQSEG